MGPAEPAGDGARRAGGVHRGRHPGAAVRGPSTGDSSEAPRGGRPERRNDAVEQKRIAEQRLWEATFEQARAERLSGNRWRALELVAEAARSKVTPELEREGAEAVTAFGLRLVAKTPGRSLMFSGGDGPFIAFTADGSLFAVPNVFHPDPDKPTESREG